MSSIYACNCLEPLAPIYVDAQFSDMCVENDQTDENSPRQILSALTSS